MSVERWVRAAPIPALFVAAGVALLLAAPAVARAQDRAPSRCPRPQGIGTPLDALTTGEGEIRPTASSLVIPFGGSRNRAKREIPLDVANVPEANDIRAVVRGDIVREDQLKVIPKGNNQVSVFVRRDGPGQYTLVACVDPSNPNTVDPGTYQGNILILASGAKPSSLPVTVTLREDTLWIPILAALVGVMAGLALKAIRDLLKGPGVTLASTRAYLSSGQFAVQALVGVGLAAYVVWKTYVESPTFGGAAGDYAALVGAAFGGMVSGSVLGDIGVGGVRQLRGTAEDEATSAEFGGPPDSTPPPPA